MQTFPEIASNLSKWLFSRLRSFDPFDYRIIVLYSRCSAYYKLGEFRETVADAHRLLAILPANAHAVQTTYKLLTVSYLRLGEYKSAQSTAIEYANRIGGPEAR